jgi:sensor histidine kinase regulating citrate/malate metabolism
VLPFTSVFIIVLLYRYSLIVNIKGYQLCTLIAAAALVLSNMLVLYVIKKQETYYIIQERLAFAETHIKNQLAHYSELYIQQEELKKFRHDIKNYYISLISALETMPSEEAVAYLKEKTNMEIIKDKAINSGNPVIDAIIQAKSAVAKRKNINIESTIKLTETIYIDELELGVLIGSALDNAIEAVSESEELRNKTIVLRIISSGEMLSIEVSNPTKENVDVQNIKTTKKDSANHGYGLNSIKSIADKYNGNLTLSCKDNYFTLSCLLVNSNTK